ncbi:MAG TPA: transporter, partial [Bryobacteraceae bacterium]
MSLRRWKSFAPLALASALLFTAPAKGQQSGHYLEGATGLMNGSLAPPGFYLGYVQFEYFVDSIDGPNGRSIPAHVTLSAPIAAITGVTKMKFLGADYGFAFLVPIMNQRFSTNIFPNRTFTSPYGVSDIFFTPIELGWHKSKADFLFSYTFAAPTGDFSSDQVFNSGLGMWSHMFQLGTTYYPEKTKKWNASILSTWEICSTKPATNVRPGSQMALEYGIGRRMLRYALNVGIAGSYYRKLTLDSGTGIAFHDQENSIGPEVSLTLPPAHLAFDVR